MMGIRKLTNDQKNPAAQIGLEEVVIIAENGTFLNPKANYGADNWGNRGILLEKYKKLSQALKRST